MRQKRVYDVGEREKEEEPKHDDDNSKVLATRYYSSFVERYRTSLSLSLLFSSSPSPSPYSVTSSSTSGSITFDEQSVEGRLLLHREFLEVVYSLCSDVSLRKNTLHLNM